MQKCHHACAFSRLTDKFVRSRVSAAVWHFHVRPPLWHLEAMGAQLEGDFSLMAVMKPHSGSGEHCSSRVPAEASHDMFIIIIPLSIQ